MTPVTSQTHAYAQEQPVLEQHIASDGFFITTVTYESKKKDKVI